MGLMLLDDDVVDIATRVRLGDATVGWRGDPALDVMLDDGTGQVQVWGFDVNGQRCVMVSVHASEPGFRHEILRKLRDGDWQRPDTVDRFMADFERQHKAEADRLDEFNEEKAERLAWAIKRDVGHHLGDGTTREVY